MFDDDGVAPRSLERVALQVGILIDGGDASISVFHANILQQGFATAKCLISLAHKIRCKTVPFCDNVGLLLCGYSAHPRMVFVAVMKAGSG